MLITENRARCTSLSSPKSIEHESRTFTISEARFDLLKGGHSRGQMLFWNQDAQQIEKLSLGKIYEFSALTEILDCGALFFFIPNHTKFKEITTEEGKNLDF